MARSFVVIAAIAVFVAAAAAQHAGDPETDIAVHLVSDAGVPPGLYGLLTTTSLYPCAGYSLRTTVTRERDTISVRISGLVRPVPCFTMMEEARGSVYLGNPAFGTYVLRIVFQDRADMYRMICYDRVPTLVPIVHRFTTITY